jgi:hypothetical protein
VLVSREVHCCNWLELCLLSRTYRQRSCRSRSTGHARSASFQQTAPYQMWRFGNLLLQVERWHTRFVFWMPQVTSIEHTLIQIVSSSTLLPGTLVQRFRFQKSDLTDVYCLYCESSLSLVFVLRSRCRWRRMKTEILVSWIPETGSFRDTVSVRVVSSVRERWPAQSNWWAQRFASRPRRPCPGWLCCRTPDGCFTGTGLLSSSGSCWLKNHYLPGSIHFVVVA